MGNGIKTPFKEYVEGCLNLNETEKEIIREISESGGNLSAYVISKRVPFSYPGVFRYCKKLEERGILLSEEGKGEKKSKTNLYRITLFGFCVYFFAFVDPQLGLFIPRYERTDSIYSLNMIKDPGFILFFNKVIQTVELNKDLDNILPPFLSIIQTNEREFNENALIGLIYLKFINDACFDAVKCNLSDPKSDKSDENIRKNLYESIDDLIYDDIMNGDTPVSNYYINAVKILLSTLNLDTINFLMQYCLSKIVKLNLFLPEEINFSTDLEKIRSYLENS